MLVTELLMGVKTPWWGEEIAHDKEKFLFSPYLIKLESVYDLNSSMGGERKSRWHL